MCTCTCIKMILRHKLTDHICMCIYMYIVHLCVCVHVYTLYIYMYMYVYVYIHCTSMCVYILQVQGGCVIKPSLLCVLAQTGKLFNILQSVYVQYVFPTLVDLGISVVTAIP